MTALIVDHVVESAPCLHILLCLSELASLLAVPRLFTPEIASFYESYYKNKGINIIKGTSVTAFEKDDQGNVRFPK